MTEKDVQKVLGALIGGLHSMGVDADMLRRQVQWWAETSKVWELLDAAKRQSPNIKTAIMDELNSSGGK